MAVDSFENSSVEVGMRDGMAWSGTLPIAPAAPTVIDLTNVDGVNWLELGCAIVLYFEAGTGYYKFSKSAAPAISAAAAATVAQRPGVVPQNTPYRVRVPRVRTPGTAPYRYLALSGSAAITGRAWVASE